MGFGLLSKMGFLDGLSALHRVGDLPDSHFFKRRIARSFSRNSSSALESGSAMASGQNYFGSYFCGDYSGGCFLF